MASFAVPTITFRTLYCFFVAKHARRRILHVNVTSHASSEWFIQQLRETLPEVAPYRYIILDHEVKFDRVEITLMKATALKPKRTGIQTPRHKGLSER